MRLGFSRLALMSSPEKDSPGCVIPSPEPFWPRSIGTILPFGTIIGAKIGSPHFGPNRVKSSIYW